MFIIHIYKFILLNIDYVLDKTECADMPLTVNCFGFMPVNLENRFCSSIIRFRSTLSHLIEPLFIVPKQTIYVHVSIRRLKTSQETKRQ